MIKLNHAYILLLILLFCSCRQLRQCHTVGDLKHFSEATFDRNSTKTFNVKEQEMHTFSEEEVVIMSVPDPSVRRAQGISKRVGRSRGKLHRYDGYFLAYRDARPMEPNTKFALISLLLLLIPYLNFLGLAGLLYFMRRARIYWMMYDTFIYKGRNTFNFILYLGYIYLFLLIALIVLFFLQKNGII